MRQYSIHFHKASLCGNKAFYIGLGLLSVAFWSCGLSKPVAARRLWEWIPGQADRKTNVK